jgi:hypothetical protein
MNPDWLEKIIDTSSSKDAWDKIFKSLLEIALNGSSPVAIYDSTVIPDRILAEAAWELWEEFPCQVERTSSALKKWCADPSPAGKAVLIMDALSLRELSLILGGAKARNVKPDIIKITSAESPSTTDQFAKALNILSRSALDNDNKPGTFALFDSNAYTDVKKIPFEDYTVPPTPNLVIWDTWLDDIIHLQNKLPDQISKITNKVLQEDGFWGFVNKLRQGRKLVITSDHGYAVSKRFSSEVTDPEAVEILRKTFGASRYKPASEKWQKRFMPPIVITHNNQHMIVGQRKWKVQGGFPHVCHGGLSLLEMAAPFIELPEL